MEKNLRFEFEHVDSQNETQKFEVEFLKMVDGIDEELFKIDEKLASVGEDIERLTSHADWIDVGAAVTSGILTGLIDSLFVGENASVDKTEVAKKFAKRKGWDNNGSQTQQKFMEEKYKTPNDGAYQQKGSGTNGKEHRLNENAHHPTLLGLVSFIITKTIRVTAYSNSKGETKFVGIKTDAKDFLPIIVAILSGILSWLASLAEKQIEIKTEIEIPDPIKQIVNLVATTPALIELFKTVDLWIGHIMSDVGTDRGIPGVMLSLLKIVSEIPPFNAKGLPKVVKTLYESKECNFEKDIGNMGKQSLPVLINETIVRTFYFIRHLAEELKDKEDFSQVDWEKTIPFGNRTIDRMMTIATGTFTAVDCADAMIRGLIDSLKTASGWVGFFKQTIARINISGIGRFIWSGITEIKDEFKKGIEERELLRLKNNALCLMQAKLYHGESLLWQAQKDANQSIGSLINVIEQNLPQILQDVKATQESVEQIEKLDLEKVEQHNEGLLNDVLDIL